METIGQKLKAAREKSGLSSSDVARAIRVKTDYIVAIEKNEFHKLIAPIYARGFVKLYAQHLQLDPMPFLRQFDTLESPAASPAKPESPRRKDSVGRKKRALLKVSFAIFQEAWKRIKSIDIGRLCPPDMPTLEWRVKKRIILIGAVVICLAVLMLLLTHSGSSASAIRVPNTARWLADPPEPYLEIPSQKTRK